jgi:hypothetical protein
VSTYRGVLAEMTELDEAEGLDATRGVVLKLIARYLRVTVGGMS